MSRKIIPSIISILWRVIKSGIVTALWVVLLVAYARYIEPNYLWVTDHKVKLASLAAGSSLKLVHITDLHNHYFSSPEYFTTKVNREQPDLIVLTGDVFDGREDRITYIDEYLAPLQAKVGKYFVFGNNEYSSRVDREQMVEHLSKAGFTILNNSHQQLIIRGQVYWLIGVDDPHYEHDNLAKAIKGVGSGPKILLAHSPEIIYKAADQGLDLVLVGHTHGGQLRLPGLTGLVVNVRPGFEQYERGLYKVGTSQMYVNSGIGTTRLPLRFLVPPELAVIQLEKKI